MSQAKSVTAIVGQPIQIVLQSNVGSTGYGWYLSSLDGGLALFASCVTPTSAMPGAPSNHAFDFLALKEGTYKAEFILVAPWRIDEPAQTETYEIEIKTPSKTAADDIEEAMKHQRFTSADAVSPDSGPSMVLKYATPMASPVLKYAAPTNTCDASQPVIVYAAPMAAAAPQSVAFQQPCGPAAQPPFNLLYAAPMAQATMAPVTNIYAAPINQASFGAQPVYAAPMSQPMPMYAAPLPLCPTDPRMAAAVSMLYAAPMAQAQYAASPVCPPADPRMATPPFTILYAAPMAQANQMAQPLYAAPMTQAVQALYAAPMAKASFAMPPYAAPYIPGTGCCC